MSKKNVRNNRIPAMHNPAKPVDVRFADDGIYLASYKRGEDIFMPGEPPALLPGPGIHANAKFSQEVVGWAKDAARKGATNRAICQALQITENTLYNWFKKTPQFKYELLIERRKRISDLAVKNVEEKISDGDVNVSKWWLNNVERDTFHAKANT